MDKMVKQAIAKLTQLESQDALKDARPVRKGTFGEGQFLYLAESLPYSSETIFGMLQDRGKRGVPVDDLYRQL
jgi:hypothetical protein